MSEFANNKMIHLVNPMTNPNGGSEKRTMDLKILLSKTCQVKLWSDRKYSPFLKRNVNIHRVRWPFLIPRGGTLVFVGAYFTVGRWLGSCNPSRVIVIFNTPEAENLYRLLNTLKKNGLDTKVDIVYASNYLKSMIDLPGVIHRSPIDISRFAPKTITKRNQIFTVGRLSRDEINKHHPDDVLMWKHLADLGIKVRLMGATCLEHQIPKNELIEILPAGAEDPREFLHTLDVLVYRSSPVFLEAFGRVVFEAMACGLPVVCGNQGGYTEEIENGVNGFLFDSTCSAIDMVIKLKADPALVCQIGKAARQTTENMYSAEEMERMREFYTS